MTEIDASALSRLTIENLLRRTARGLNNISVNARQTHCFNAALTKRREYVCIDLAREDHLRHLEGCIIGYAAPFDNRLFNPEFLSQFTQLLPTTANNTDANANLMQ